MKQYVIDAFADAVFEGNPAAVCILEEWIPDDLMMKITAENRYSETAFAVKGQGAWGLRWFTPGGEIDLCGHATLATAHALLGVMGVGGSEVAFETMSGTLSVRRAGSLYEMDFPAYELVQVDVTEQMGEAFGARPSAAYLGRDLLCIFDDEEAVRRLDPDQEKLAQLDGLLQHASARGGDFDCVSRSFAPKCAVPEDPVCGSGHCHIAPYWARELGKESIVARQASERGGTLFCTVGQGRVTLAGKAALYAVSDLVLEGVGV